MTLQRMGIPKWKMKMDHELTTLPEALKEAGYRTAFVGKWHLSASDSVRLPTDQGFDVNVAGGWKGR